MTARSRAIQITEKDSVAVALEDLQKGEDVFGISLIDDIGKGHKFALNDLAVGENIIKYGYPIGHLIDTVSAGQHIHTHNLKTNLKGKTEYEYAPKLSPKAENYAGTFLGYLRHDGKAGIRNEIWIVNTVGCVNKVAERIALEANRRFAGRTDGIFTFVHPFGCSQLGDDQRHTQMILANMAKHPNAAAVLVLGLGCENNNIDVFKKVLGEYDPKRIKFLNAQDSEDEIETALQIIEGLITYAETFKRQELDISKLIIGLKCGGSDGLSGITANPLAGRISDRLAAGGGITILSEVPEMFGAETILMDRCESEELFEKTVKLINDFKEYFIRYNQEIYENPSPGNKNGGISTLEDKSLGCTQKGGTSNVRAVLDYGAAAEVPGLNLLKGPGNDIVAITGLMAAGAQMILFTTGRGTPIGAPVPTVKIATNSELAQRKTKWIDFDAGRLLSGETMDGLTDVLWEKILDLASGKIQARNEKNGYREIAIFKDGVTL